MENKGESSFVREIITRYRKTKTERFLINTPALAFKFLKPRIGDQCQETFCIMCVDNKNTVIYFKIISVGTVSEAIVHPREVFSPAIRELSSGVIVAHNHPSGTLEPSRQDIETTRRLTEAGKIVGIPVLDHIIVSDQDFYSMKENGYMG